MSVLQLHGRGGNSNPHSHLVVSEGGIDKDGQWRTVSYFDTNKLRRKWQYHVITALKKAVRDTAYEKEWTDRLGRMFHDDPTKFDVHAMPEKGPAERLIVYLYCLRTGLAAPGCRCAQDAVARQHSPSVSGPGETPEPSQTPAPAPRERQGKTWSATFLPGAAPRDNARPEAQVDGARTADIALDTVEIAVHLLCCSRVSRSVSRRRMPSEETRLLRCLSRVPRATECNGGYP